MRKQSKENQKWKVYREYKGQRKHSGVRARGATGSRVRKDGEESRKNLVDG